MSDTRKYPKSGRRSILNASNLAAKSGQDTIVCVPIGALDIARSLIRDRGYWRTSYAVDYDDAGYTLPGGETMDTITAMLDLFLEGTNEMNCESIITELGDIGDAIAALGAGGGCNCGSAGAGQTPPATETTDTGDITLPTGVPPAGYTSWEQYVSVKCDIATWIMTNILADVRWFQVIQIGTLTFGALAAGMLSVLSAFTLTGVLAALLAILAYEITMLEELEAVLVANFDDLVCAILTGETAQGSMDAFITSINADIVAAIPDSISEFLLQQLVSYWTDPTQFNLLYADYDSVLGKQVPAGADCESCGIPCTNFKIQQGVWQGGLRFDSVWAGNAHRIEVRFNSNTSNCDNCGPEESISILSYSGHAGHPDREDWRMWSTDGACIAPVTPDIYNSNTPPAIGQQYCIRFFSFVSTTPWSIDLARHGGCV